MQALCEHWSCATGPVSKLKESSVESALWTTAKLKADSNPTYRVGRVREVQAACEH